MFVYVVFLRAINLGAKRKFGKDDVARVTSAAGFADVATYLNTGNVRVSSALTAREDVERTLAAAYEQDRGFEVPCIAFDPAELTTVVAAGERLEREWAEEGRGTLVRHYVYLLKEALGEDEASALESRSGDEGVVAVSGRSVHALLSDAYVPGNVDPLGVAPRLGVGTNRTMNVLRTLVTRWCGADS